MQRKGESDLATNGVDLIKGETVATELRKQMLSNTGVSLIQSVKQGL